jgi:hypothetical protein
MKKLSTLLAVAALVVGGSASAIDFAEVGTGQGVLVDPGDAQCGTLVFNADGSYENGYAWQYGGVVPPDFGAFAECYFFENEVCANVFDLSQVGGQAGQTMDSYVWDDAGGIPGAVNCVVVGADPGPVAFWPSVSRHTIPMPLCCTGEAWWVGYWGNWPGLMTAWFIGADLDGFGGCPFTHIAPGIGFPTGWTNVSVVWGPTQALGIGCEVNPCEPTPTIETTWGAIKNLYN